MVDSHAVSYPTEATNKNRVWNAYAKLACSVNQNPGSAYPLFVAGDSLCH